MTLEEKQKQLVEDLLHIHDRQERLSILVDRARSAPPLLVAEKTPGNRVPGCVSPVWVQGRADGGRLHLRFAAEAPVVQGLVGLMCELYDGATLQEVRAIEPSLFEELELIRDLSPTRRNGLAAVRQRIKGLAEAAL